MPNLEMASAFLIWGFCPGILWLLYFHMRESEELNTIKLMVKSYFLGILVAFPTVIIGILINQGNTYLSAVLAAPLIEESLKYFAFLFYPYRHPKFTEPSHGILFSTSIALGFASIENVGYIYSSYPDDSFQRVFVLRSLLSVPGHALMSCIWGNALGLYRFQAISFFRAFFALFIGMLAHSIFNALASIPNLEISVTSLAFFILFLWFRVHRNLKRAKNLTAEC